MIDDLFIAADHQTIAAIETPHAPAGAGIDIIDALLLQRASAAYIVLVEAVAAVDDNVAGLQHTAQFVHRILGRFASRQHQPDGARGAELCRQILEAAAADRALSGERRYRIGTAVIDDARMTVALQALHDVTAHAAETNDAELHTPTSSQRCLRCRAERGDTGIKIMGQVRAQHAAAALRQHAEDRRAPARPRSRRSSPCGLEFLRPRLRRR